jgi:hypothetical protein
VMYREYLVNDKKVLYFEAGVSSWVWLLLSLSFQSFPFFSFLPFIHFFLSFLSSSFLFFSFLFFSFLFFSFVWIFSMLSSYTRGQLTNERPLPTFSKDKIYFFIHLSNVVSSMFFKLLGKLV